MFGWHFFVRFVSVHAKRTNGCQQHRKTKRNSISSHTKIESNRFDTNQKKLESNWVNSECDVWRRTKTLAIVLLCIFRPSLLLPHKCISLLAVYLFHFQTGAMIMVSRNFRFCFASISTDAMIYNCAVFSFFSVHEQPTDRTTVRLTADNN